MDVNFGGREVLAHLAHTGSADCRSWERAPPASAWPAITHSDGGVPGSARTSSDRRHSFERKKLPPPDPHAVFERRLAVGRHRHVEPGRERRCLLVLVIRLEHRPIAAQGLVYFSRDGLGLVVAQRDLIRHLVSVVGQDLVISLLPLL